MENKDLTFQEAFPDLNLSPEIRALLRDVTVERVTINQKKNLLHVYLRSPNWIKKQTIYETEDAIAEQIFDNAGMQVRIVERFVLSQSYTPGNFYEVYRSSMLLELKTRSPLLYQMLVHAELRFTDEGRIEAEVPGSVITERKSAAFASYLDRVFRERAGFSVEIECLHKEHSEEDLFRADSERIRQTVESVMRDNESRKAKKNEEVRKLPERNKKGVIRKRSFRPDDPELIYGVDFSDEPRPIAELSEEPGEITIRGEVHRVDFRETRNGRLILQAILTDQTDSIRIKLWLEPSDRDAYEAVFKKGSAFVIKGMMDFDPFDKEMILRSVYGIRKSEPLTARRIDHAKEKRVELHCHTKMSDMDAVSDTKALIRRAYEWGQNAIAITDHGVVQAFPEALHAIGGKGGIPADADMKILYGMEAYLVDDTQSIVFGETEKKVGEPVVVFSLITTGRSPYEHAILEIGAVRIADGNIQGEFRTLVDPDRPIPFSVTQIHGITDDMVADAPSQKEALSAFLDFAGDDVLVAYGAEYKMSFLKESAGRTGLSLPEVFVDIPSVVRYLIPDFGRLTFERLLKERKIPCSDPMRAFPRSQAMANLYIQLLEEMKKKDIRTLRELNREGKVDPKRIVNLPYYHAVILMKSEIGRRNLYRLVSESHLNYFKRRPRIPKSLLTELRDGLILGSACSAGELYQAILHGKSDAEIARIVSYYDYLEIQPTGNNAYLLKENDSGIETEEQLRAINQKIVRLGEQFRKPVCATGDVHFLDPEDAIYRRIIQVGHGYPDEEQPPLYLKTTDEMLDEFSYLGEKKAYEVVVTNTRKIADQIGRLSPIHPDKCPPEIPHSEEDLRAMCLEKAEEMYGDPLPEKVRVRLMKELDSICKNGYSVMYIIAQKLVAKSLEDGYLVGSRGSVGSSLVARMANITEVNPLPPHYYCPNCHYSDFDSEKVRAFAGQTGADMPKENCPNCGRELMRDGFDIPFETFLGFEGDKEPDIDLNFAGEEQAKAQAYTEIIFGKGQTFKAGTIGTIAEKTAYGYAMHYFEEKGEQKRSCELERLSEGCVGVRRTTGQHPGGIIVVPKGMNINWFTPIQHPANDTESDIITTHFDYHSIDRNLLKLDILGHDDPSMLRMLHDLTGVDPMQIPLDDPDVLSLFSGTQALGISPEQIGGCPLGCLGVPEFGTDNVIQMLLETKPASLADLIRISGLSHGTNVWHGNAQDYIKSGDATLKTAICTRDDIMLYLIEKGVEASHAFKIMERVRKGKGLKPAEEEEMKEHEVPAWYIESCKKIEYMFPKAHASAYVMNAFRIAYYKIHHPLAYYAAYFSIRSTGFRYGIMCSGPEKLEQTIVSYELRMNELTANDKDLLRDMKIVREMYARGYSFTPMELYEAKATKFRIIDGKLMASLNTIEGLGDLQAEVVEAETAKGPFLSKDDFRSRTKVSKTVIDTLTEFGVLSDIPETNQISLFDTT